MRTLKQALMHGLKLKKVDKVFHFDQKPSRIRDKIR